MKMKDAWLAMENLVLPGNYPMVMYGFSPLTQTTFSIRFMQMKVLPVQVVILTSIFIPMQNFQPVPCGKCQCFFTHYVRIAILTNITTHWTPSTKHNWQAEIFMQPFAWIATTPMCKEE